MHFPLLSQSELWPSSLDIITVPPGLLLPCCSRCHCPCPGTDGACLAVSRMSQVTGSVTVRGAWGRGAKPVSHILCCWVQRIQSLQWRGKRLNFSGASPDGESRAHRPTATAASYLWPWVLLWSRGENQYACCLPAALGSWVQLLGLGLQTLFPLFPWFCLLCVFQPTSFDVPVCRPSGILV